MLSLVTVDHRSSPDKIMPFPVPVVEINNEDQNSANLAGSIMSLVKVDTEENKQLNNY